jgi:hypothetical protein
MNENWQAARHVVSSKIRGAHTSRTGTVSIVWLCEPGMHSMTAAYATPSDSYYLPLVCLDTSTLVASSMDLREYKSYTGKEI